MRILKLLYSTQTHNKAFNRRYSRKNTRLPLDSFSATSLLQSCRLTWRYTEMESA